MTPSNNESGRALNDLLTSTRVLLNQFTTSLTTSNPSSAERIDNPPDTLRVLSDSAKLIKAHTTKLSLLAINKPFTPSAIGKVVKELVSTCLPAMMSGVQICEQEKALWSSMMSKEVQARVRRVFVEMDILFKEVQSIAEGSAGTARRDSLSSTGVVWESCDAVVELETLGLGGLALQKAQQYRATIKDAVNELRDWAEGDDLDTEGRDDGLLDLTDEGVDGDRDSIEDIFNAANSMPKDRPELRELAIEADEKLKKVVILYTALEKRRLRTFKGDAKQDTAGKAGVARLDALMLHLRRIPFQVDEMASVLYDLDAEAAKLILRRSIDEALSASKLMELDWDDREDGSTPWLRKWNNAIS